MRKITIIGLLAALAVGVACGGAEPSVEEGDPTAVTLDGTPAVKGEAAPKAITAKPGTTLTVNTAGITAAWTLTKVETKAADQYGMKPDNGGQWVLAHVKVAVSQGRETYVCSCDLSVVSKTGKVYEPTFASFKNRPDLTGATVAPGQNTDGWVIFGVAKADLKQARIQLKQQSLFADTAFGYWTLTK